MIDLEAEYSRAKTIACIIPFFNGSATVERAIKSVVHQTRLPDEFIIVNDGSEREERGRLCTLQLKYNFTIIDQSNAGQGAARNIGVLNSKSDLICFLDQDDYFLPNHVYELFNALPVNDKTFGYIFSDYSVGTFEGNILQRCCLTGNVPLQCHNNIKSLLRNSMSIVPSCAMISKLAFEAIGGFDTQFRGYEDDDLFLRFFYNGYSDYYLNKNLLVWCIHTNSASFSITMSRSGYLYFNKLADSFKDDPVIGNYYLRDCLLPRFIPVFINELAEAKKNHSPHYDELLAKIIECRKRVEANDYISRGTKNRLALEIAFLSSFPFVFFDVYTKSAKFFRRIKFLLRRIVLHDESGI